VVVSRGELTVSLVERGEDRRHVVAAGEGRYAIWFSGQLLGIRLADTPKPEPAVPARRSRLRTLADRVRCRNR
jgi:hypothetical protein